MNPAEKPLPQLTEKDKARFWAKVDKRGSDECWKWQGTHLIQGYGVLRFRDQTYLAHRLSWKIHFGDIPLGLFVLHKCDQPSCCNPSCLWLGSRAENNADRDKKGRQRCPSGEKHWMRKYPEKLPRGDDHWTHKVPEKLSRGERHGMAKLTADKVREIRRLRASGMKRQDIAALFEIHPATVDEITFRRSWRHVE